MKVIQMVLMGGCMVNMMYGSLSGMHQHYVEEISFNECSRDEQSLLVYEAITAKDFRRLAMYISNGWRHNAPLGIRSHPSWTALSWAIFFNHVASVKILIAAGANAVSIVDKDLTALWFARGFGNREKIITLLEQAGFVTEASDDEPCDCDKVIKTGCFCCLCVPWLALVIREELRT